MLSADTIPFSHDNMGLATKYGITVGYSLLQGLKGVRGFPGFPVCLFFNIY